MGMSSACAQEVAYAYSESGGRPLESGNITKYNGTDMVNFSIGWKHIRSAKICKGIRGNEEGDLLQGYCK